MYSEASDIDKQLLFDILRPSSPSPFFTGRLKELKYIDTFFRQNHNGVLTLRGMAGSGKTQLALKFAEITALHNDVLYVNDTTLEYVMPELLGEASIPQTNVSLDEIVRQRPLRFEINLNRSATANPPTRVGLVIFDNLTTPLSQFDYHDTFEKYMRKVFGFGELSVIYLLNVDKFTPRGHGREGYASWITEAFSETRASSEAHFSTDLFSVLETYPSLQTYTSWRTPIRSQPSLLSQPTSLPSAKTLGNTYFMLPSLGVDDAVCLLVKSACLKQEYLSIEDNEAACSVAKYFGCFPPVMVEAGTVIRVSELTMQASQQMCSEHNQEWIKRICTSLDSLLRSNYEKSFGSARVLLRLLGWLPFDQILLRDTLIRARTNIASYRPIKFAEAGLNQVKKANENILSLFTYAAEGPVKCSAIFTRAITDLQIGFGLPSSGHGEGWRRCVYDWSKAVVSDQPVTAASAAYLLAASIGSDTEHGVECRVFRSQLEPLVSNTLLCYPDICANHFHRFSLVYEACGRWGEAIRLQSRVVEKCEQQRHRNEADILFATNCLAKTYCKLGCWEDAKKLQSALLGRRNLVFGETDPDTLSLMYDLGLTVSRMGRWDEAEIIQERVCRIRKQVLGESHPDTLSAMHSLASTYSEQGIWKEAQERHENVLQTRRQVLGEKHADTLSSLHSLATMHWEAGQLSNDSEMLNLEVLDKRREALGPEHPETLSSMFALAWVYQRQGQWQAAADLAAGVLETQTKVLGRDHTDTLSTMHSLASWYSERGRLSKAISLRTEILESRRAVYGESSRETLASMEELVSEYWKQGIWAQAEILHIKLLEARKRALGDKDLTCTATSLGLATHYMSQCRWRDASLIFKEVLAVKKQDEELEVDDPDIADIQQQLDLAVFALSLDVFIISPAVPIESIVNHFTIRAGLRDYSTILQEAPNPPTAPIDRGGSSNIYRVKDKDGRELAVKCLRGACGEYKQVKQTIRELSTWSQLRHKSIAALLGLALFREQLAMVSAWNEHGNVMKYIEQQPHMDRYALCMQVVSAVVYLHKSDVVHGDLKGANILVSADGTLQLTDFGLTIMRDATIQFSQSTNEIGGGTLRWMAPELILGNEMGVESGHASSSMSETLTKAKEDKESSSPRSRLCKETDVYALGMTMLEILTGKRPFKELDKDTAVILALGKGRRPQRPNRILDQSPRGAPFWNIVKKCWAQAPGERPTANEVDTAMLLLGNE